MDDKLRKVLLNLDLGSMSRASLFPLPGPHFDRFPSFNMPFRSLKEYITMEKKKITNAQIVEALKGSIEKWVVKVDIYTGATILEPLKQVANGCSECPLCSLFGWKRASGPFGHYGIPDCTLCPLKSCSKEGDAYFAVYKAETNLEAHTASEKLVHQLKGHLAEYEARVEAGKEAEKEIQVGDIVGYISESAKVGERQVFEVEHRKDTPGETQVIVRNSYGNRYNKYAHTLQTIYRPAKK